MSSTANSDGANQGSDTATRPPRGWRGTWAGIPFIAVLLTILGLGMAGILILNTSIQQQENQLEGLQSQAQAAGYRQALLQGQVDQLSTTDVLAAQAANLGMVPNTNPVIIEMPSGQVVGSPQPAAASDLPGVAVPSQVASPTPQISIIPAAPVSSATSSASSAAAPSSPAVSTPTVSTSAPTSSASSASSPATGGTGPR